MNMPSGLIGNWETYYKQVDDIKMGQMCDVHFVHSMVWGNQEW